MAMGEVPPAPGNGPPTLLANNGDSEPAREQLERARLRQEDAAQEVAFFQAGLDRPMHGAPGHLSQQHRRCANVASEPRRRGGGGRAAHGLRRHRRRGAAAERARVDGGSGRVCARAERWRAGARRLHAAPAQDRALRRAAQGGSRGRLLRPAVLENGGCLLYCRRTAPSTTSSAAWTCRAPIPPRPCHGTAASPSIRARRCPQSRLAAPGCA